MSHEDCQQARYKISCQQGRTFLLLLILLTTYVPGQLARTVIIGQGRKIIADLGERPVPQLAPRPRIGEDAFLLSGNCVFPGKLGRGDARPKKASRVVPSYSETPYRRQEEVRKRGLLLLLLPQVEYWTPSPPANGHAKPEYSKPELPQPNLRPHRWPYR